MGQSGENKLFFSQELIPNKAPDNVQIQRLSETSVNVTWNPLTLFEAQGFPQYIVMLTPVTQSHQWRQAKPTIVTSNSFAMFTHLDTEYSVVVSATTGGGSDSVMSSLPVNSKFILISTVHGLTQTDQTFKQYNYYVCITVYCTSKISSFPVPLPRQFTDCPATVLCTCPCHFVVYKYR